MSKDGMKKDDADEEELTEGHSGAMRMHRTMARKLRT